MKKLTQTWKQQKGSRLRDSSFTASKDPHVTSRDGGKRFPDSTGFGGVVSPESGPCVGGGTRKRLGQHISRQVAPLVAPKPVQHGAGVERREKENAEDAAKRRKGGPPGGHQNKKHSPCISSLNPAELNHSFPSSFGGEFDFDDDVLQAVEKAEADFNKIQEDAVPLRETTAPKQNLQLSHSRDVQMNTSRTTLIDNHHQNVLTASTRDVGECPTVPGSRSAIEENFRTGNSGPVVNREGNVFNKQVKTKANSGIQSKDGKGSSGLVGDKSIPVRTKDNSHTNKVQYTSISTKDDKSSSDIHQKSYVPCDPTICQASESPVRKQNGLLSRQSLLNRTTTTKTASKSSSANSPVKVNTTGQTLSAACLPVRETTSTFLDSIFEADSEIIEDQKEVVVFCEDSQDQDVESVPKTRGGSGKHPELARGLLRNNIHQATPLSRNITPGKVSRSGQKSSSKIIPQALASRRRSISPGTSTATTPKPTNRSMHRRSPPRTPISPPPPSTPARDQLLLSSWGLPDVVLQQYHRAGIIKMFPWQVECLGTGRVLEGGNLVYAAPTSAGKTLVAELLVLKKVLETKKKALIILPFVSVTREKMFYLQSLFSEAGVRVDGFMGSHSPAGGFASTDIAICTIEKANSLINRLLEEKAIGQLGIVVVDELHMIGDSHRGYLLELLLTKIRYVTATSLMSSMDKDGERPSNPIQIVGMSATLPNLDLLARWLDADLYRTDYRPVPLTEHVKIGKTVFDTSMKQVREVKPPFEVKGDEDQVFSLCLETISKGNGVLVFCPTKNWCEKLCEMMAREIYRLHQGEVATGNTGFMKASNMLPVKLDHASLRDVIEQLRRTPVNVNTVLRRTIPCGVAYHHAGLTFDERDIIEGAFRHGFIKILVATSTLSSGVNLPARRVIIRSIMFNRKVIDPLTYKQMIGRAGRKGVDTEGESILVCKTTERDKASKLMKCDLPAVQSCLVKRQGDDLSNSLKRAILEIIASGVTSSPTEVQAYASSTLLAASLTEVTSEGQRSEVNTGSAVLSCVKFLEENEFIRLQNVESEGEMMEKYCPTQLGKATLSSALSPDEALHVFAELQKARKNFVLENELHILYQVTPIYNQGFQPDWYQFVCTWENMSSDQRRVAELVGVEESFLMRASQGVISSASRSARVQQSIAIHQRFYTTLILQELVNEVPLPTVAAKYNCGFGQLQSLQQSASTFSGMVTVFCSRLGWYNLELLLAQFQSRLNFGVQRELCDLVRISLLNAQRARLLYDAGYPTVAAVAACDPADVETLLRNSVPFRSGRQAQGEDAYEAVERKQTRCIWATGRKGLTEAEAAKLIVSEAREIVQAELGVANVAWSRDEEKDKGGRDETGMEAGGEGMKDDGSASRGKEDAGGCLKHVPEGSNRIGNKAIEHKSKIIPATNLEKEFTIVKGCNVKERLIVDDPVQDKPSTSSKRAGNYINAATESDAEEESVLLKGHCNDPSAGKPSTDGKPSEMQVKYAIDNAQSDVNLVERISKLSGYTDRKDNCANPPKCHIKQSTAQQIVKLRDKSSSNQSSNQDSSFKHPSVLSRATSKDTKKNQITVNVQVHTDSRNRTVEPEPVLPAASVNLVTAPGSIEEKSISVSLKEQRKDTKDTKAHSAASDRKDQSPESIDQEKMRGREKITSTPHTAEDSEPPQGCEKETSPDLFSCPLDEGDLEEALQRMADAGDCATPSRGPGNEQPLQETSHNVDEEGMLMSEDDGISPTFPSMDSQLEQYMAEYCTQNDIVAESASPDLDKSKKNSRRNMKDCQDATSESEGRSNQIERKLDSSDDAAAGKGAQNPESNSMSHTVIANHPIDSNAQETVQSQETISGQQLETTQDVLLAAAMCDSFDSFSCSTETAVTTENTTNRTVLPHNNLQHYTDGHRIGKQDRHTKPGPSLPETVKSPSKKEKALSFLEVKTDSIKSPVQETDNAMHLSSDESFSFSEFPCDFDKIERDQDDDTVIFVGKSESSSVSSSANKGKSMVLGGLNRSGAKKGKSTSAITEGSNECPESTNQDVGKQSVLANKKSSKHAELPKKMGVDIPDRSGITTQGKTKVSVSSKNVSKKTSVVSSKPKPVGPSSSSISRTAPDDTVFSPDRERKIQRKGNTLLSPGTLAMLDLFAGEEDDDVMFTQLKETQKNNKDKSVLTGMGVNATKGDKKGAKVGNQKGQVTERVQHICKMQKDKISIPPQGNTIMTSNEVSVAKVNQTNETSVCKGMDSATAKSHLKRKNEQSTCGSPPKRQRTPPKAQEGIIRNGGVGKILDGVDITANSEHPERRPSDTGDYIPPTPPPAKPVTPRASKAAGTQNAKGGAGQMQASGRKKKTPARSQGIPKRSSPRSASARRRQNLEAVIEEQQSKTVYSDDKSRPETKKQPSVTCPEDTNKISHKTLLPNDQRRVPSSTMTPCLDSEMLYQDSEEFFSPGPVGTQDAFNMGMDEFDFSLRFSMDGENQIPPSPHPAPTAATSQLHHQSNLSSFTPSFSFPQSFSCSPAIPSSDNAFTIVDVCANVDLFDTFLSEWKRKKRYAVAIACERYRPPVQSGTIGGNFKKPGTGNRTQAQCKPDGFPVDDLELLVTGIAVCWGGKDAYFVSLQKEIVEVDADDTLAPPENAPNLSVSDRLSKIRPVLEIEKLGRTAKAKYHHKVVFGAKKQYKVLSQACGCLIAGSLEDPKIAQWMIDPASKEPNLQSLVTQYTPIDAHLLEVLGGGVGLTGPGISPDMNGSSRLRATTEAVLSLQVMDTMQKVLEELNLWQPFIEVEMPSIVTLARVELNGIGIDGAECETQKSIMQAKLKSLEEEAYKMAGHGFSLTSTEDVAQVLYTELKFPPNGDPSAISASAAPARRTLGARGRPRLAKHFSTSKDALEKLKPLHPLPGIILEFRRISAAVAKVVFPLQKEKVHNGRVNMDRVFTVYQTHTATGRVATFEPNIQAIPKEFNIDMPSVIGESPPGGGAGGAGSYVPSSVASGRSRKGRMTRIGAYTPLTMSNGPTPRPGPKFAVSIRHVFCPFKGGLMLAADYSQLELRLLAHLAKDKCLMNILNSGSDVFKQIAANWKHVDVESVSPEQRQQAKQMCYGMIYGIGARALGEQLDVCEEDAAAFMESFKAQYKGMKNYMLDVVKQCKESGYVQTLTGRRRYLPSIHHTNPGARSQAERQAVNTTVQGSAADLVKTAMVKIDRRLAAEFPATKRSHRHRQEEELGIVPSRRKSRRFQTSNTGSTPTGAFLVLQLHDELIYEVRREDVHQVAQLIKTEMEGAMKLSVKLPVKVKVGPTWGTLQDMDL